MKQSFQQPFVSICMPTFNRRPFIPFIIKCFDSQTYPKEKMEWIIVDDGTDKIEDLVAHLPCVRYIKYDKKLTLGAKRNIANKLAKGDILVYMDDDDYYPPERVEHAVDTLLHSNALCAGSSAMYIYFKHIGKMLRFGPYGPNHSTAATFAFKKELLKQTKFDDTSSVAEEKLFLKNYTIPVVQLDPLKSILVFSHNHNSFDKKQLLDQAKNNPNIHETDVLPKDVIKDPEILHFFMEDIDDLLHLYHPGDPKNKPDVLKQLEDIRIEREKRINEYQKNRQLYNGKISHSNPAISMASKMEDNRKLISELEKENYLLHEKNEHLERKIKQLLNSVDVGNKDIGVERKSHTESGVNMNISLDEQINCIHILSMENSSLKEKNEYLNNKIKQVLNSIISKKREQK